jgi:hypothetical protein
LNACEINSFEHNGHELQPSFWQVFQGENECQTIDTNIGVEGHLFKI